MSVLRHQFRALSTSALRPTAVKPVVKRTYTRVPRKVAPSVAPSSTTASAAAARPAAAAAATPASAPVEPSFNDFDDADFSLPEPEISDYAHLRRKASPPSASASTPSAPSAAPALSPAAALPTRAVPATMAPTASPPLTALPDASYTPLPPARSYVESVPGELAAADWTTSFRGLSERPFDKEAADALLRPLDPNDVEMKPDGLLYLPEIKYRRTLNAAFGPGGWGMAPRGETHVGPKIVSREWGLVCLGRLVAIARGEQEYFDPSGVPTATEACKSNALMRCCKDLGIASELWDPRFIREYKAKYCVEMMVEHITQKKKRKLWRKKDAKFEYPYKEIGPAPK